MEILNMEIFGGVLSVWQLLTALVLGGIITSVFIRVRDVMSIWADPTKAFNSIKEVAEVLDSCFAVFPVDSLVFRGVTYSRGMIIKVTMRNLKTFEGYFVGLNHDNILCVLTEKSLAAYIVHDIKNIDIINGDDGWLASVQQFVTKEEDEDNG